MPDGVYCRLSGPTGSLRRARPRRDGNALGRVIIETLPRWEASWADLIRKANSSISLMIGTVKPEGGVQ